MEHEKNLKLNVLAITTFILGLISVVSLILVLKSKNITGTLSMPQEETMEEVQIQETEETIEEEPADPTKINIEAEIKKLDDLNLDQIEENYNIEILEQIGN